MTLGRNGHQGIPHKVIRLAGARGRSGRTHSVTKVHRPVGAPRVDGQIDRGTGDTACPKTLP